MYHIPSENRVIKTVRELKQWASPTLLSKNPQPSETEPLGAFKIQTAPKPEVTATQTAEPSHVVIHESSASTRGWTLRDKTAQELFNALPFKSLDEAQFALAEWINKLTYQIEGKYPAVIQKGWDDEEAMALAYMTETETQAQLEILQRLAAKKGRTVAEHVNRVLYLAGTFHAIKGIVHELWLETDAALEAAGTPHEYEAIFEAAKAKAAPAAAAYGLSA